MVEESLEQSRKLKSPWKASHVGTARMLLEHVEEKGGLGLTSARKERLCIETGRRALGREEMQRQHLCHAAKVKTSQRRVNTYPG